MTSCDWEQTDLLQALALRGAEAPEAAASACGAETTAVAPAATPEPETRQATASTSAEASAEMTTEASAEMTTEASAVMSTEASAVMSAEASAELTSKASAATSTRAAAEASAEASAEPAAEAARAPAPAPEPAPVVSLPELEGAARRGLPRCPGQLLILDTETTALNPAEGQCIELGAVLFDVPSRAVLTQVSFLLPCESNTAEAINGIAAEVSRLPQPWQPALHCFEAMVAQADAVLAHNAAFDRQWFGHGPLPALERPWICSMEDIRWPSARGLRSTPSVPALALAYGVPVWAAHRALTDCTYLVQVLQRCEGLEALLVSALEPRRLMRAEVSYADRQLAREAGFRWDHPVPRAWTRRLSEREAAALPFRVHPVEPDSAAPERW